MDSNSSLDPVFKRAPRVVGVLRSVGVAGVVEDQFDVDLDFVAKQLAGRTRSGSSEFGVQGEEYLQYSSDPSVLDDAIQELVRNRQDVQSSSMTYSPDDPRGLPVELEIDDPLTVVHRFNKVLANERESIVEYLVEHSLEDTSGPSLEESDEEIFSYIIEYRDADERPAFVIGGARMLRENICSVYGFTQDEGDLIKYAQLESAKRNGYDRHTLLDEVLLIPAYSVPESPYDAQKQVPDSV